MPDENTRKSTVTFGLKRLLNTGQYENIEIKVETSEEVEWSTQEERSRKIAAIQKDTTKKYSDVQSKVLAELGVAEKAAWRPKSSTPADTL